MAIQFDFTRPKERAVVSGTPADNQPPLFDFTTIKGEERQAASVVAAPAPAVAAPAPATRPAPTPPAMQPSFSMPPPQLFLPEEARIAPPQPRRLPGATIGPAVPGSYIEVPQDYGQPPKPLLPGRFGEFESRVMDIAARTAAPGPVPYETPTTGSKIGDVAAEILGTGLGFATPQGAAGRLWNLAEAAGRAGAARLPARLAPVTEPLLRGATGGAAFGGMEAAMEGKPLPETVKRAAEEAAYWTGAELGLGVVLPAAARAFGRAVDSAIGGRLSFLRDRARTSKEKAMVPAARHMEAPPRGPVIDISPSGAGQYRRPPLALPEPLADQWARVIESPAVASLARENYNAAQNQLNRMLQDIRPAVGKLWAQKRGELPLSRQELADYVWAVMGGTKSGISKAEVRLMKRPDLEELAREVPPIAASFEDLARQAAKDKGYDYDRVFEMARLTPEEHVRMLQESLHTAAAAGAIEVPPADVKSLRRLFEGIPMVRPKPGEPPQTRPVTRVTGEAAPPRQVFIRGEAEPRRTRAPVGTAEELGVYELPRGEAPIPAPGNVVWRNKAGELQNGRVVNVKGELAIVQKPDGKKVAVKQSSLLALDNAPLTEKEKGFLALVERSGMTINDAEKALRQQYDELLEEEFTYLKQSGRQGVIPGNLARDEEGNIIGRYGAVSNNPEWYQQFYREHGRAPSQKEMRELAIKRLQEGYSEEGIDVPPNDKFRSLDATLKAIDKIKNKLAAMGEIKSRPAAKTTPAKTRLETPRTETPAAAPAAVEAMAARPGTRTTENMVFYRGTTPGRTERIKTGDEFWDSLLFLSTDEKKAGYYGSHIDKYVALPGAKILREGTAEFTKVAGRWKKGESLLEFASRAAKKAKEAGYDAVVFERQGDVGTAVLNRDIFKKIGPEVEAMAARPKAAPAGEAAAATEKPLSRHVMIKRLEKALDLPIRVGRYREKALGIFKRREEVIRTGLAEDMPVIAHEAGHAVDKLLDIRNSIKDPAMEAELINLGMSQPANHFTEGIAEFMRHYLTGQDAALKQAAPKFYDWFETAARKEPKIWDALQQFRQDYIDYTTAPAVARVKAAISVGEGQKRKVTWDRIMGAAVDELRPIDTFVEKATGGKRGNLSAAEDPFVQAWLFRGWTGKARAAVQYGVYDRQGNKVAPSLTEILRPVAKNIDNFRAYIVAKRATELHGRGISTGIAVSDANATVAQFNTPEFQKAHEQLKRYQDAILDRLVESGVIGAEQKAAMRQLNQEYVPFYRVFEEQAGGVGFGKRGFGDLAQPVKKIKGSGRTIVDPLESIIKNTYYLTNIAERNSVGRTLVDFANKFEGMGKFVEKVDPKKYPITFSLKEISNLLDQVGAQVPEDALKKIATIFRPQMMGAPKENILAVFRDGKRELYQLDPELYRATLMLDREATNTLVRLLSYPTSWLRAGATLTPEFMVRNVSRDAVSAWVYSKYGFIPIVDTARGLFHVIKRDDLYQKWLSSGGASANFVSLDRDYLQGDLRKMMTTTIWERMKQFAAHPLEVLRALSEFSEEATRVGEFGKGLRTELKKGAATGEALQRAALASRDITLDFSRMGTVGKPANQLIAFFNASVQGLDKMRRAFTKGGPKGIANSTFKAAVGITLPSVFLWVLNHDDPRYQELPQWRKDLFWNILTSDHVISIPKPFELGIIFGTLPERLLDWVWDNDQDAMEQFKHTLMEVTFPNWIPTALLPAIEVASNYSFFKGQPITPMGEQYLLKQEQYGPYTTEAAKGISQALAGGGEAPLSPREIENLVQGYAGGLGMYGLQALSAGMPKEAAMPAQDISSLPGLKGISAEYYQGSASIDRFYQRLDELEKKARTAKKYSDARKPVPANLRYDTGELSRLRQTQQQLADLRKRREQIIKDRTMTPERKKTELDRLNIEMINRARASLRMKPIQSHQR